MPAEQPLETPSRSLTTGASMAAASRITVTAAGATTTIVLARVLGPEGWASYFVAVSLLTILMTATTLGVEHGIAYYVSSARWAASSAFRAALKVAMLAGVMGIVVAVAVRLAVPSAFAGLTVALTLVASLALPLALVWFYVSYIALAIDRYGVAMSLPAVQALFVLVLAVPAALLFGLAGAIAAVTLASIAVGVGAAEWGRRRLKGEAHEPPGQLRRAISFGVKGYAANTLQVVNYRLDIFVLAAVASTSAVGSYSLAVALTSLLWVLPRALADVLFPRVARLSALDDARGRAVVEAKSLRHVCLITIVSAVLFVPALRLLVVPIFGEDFRPAITLALILLPGAAAIAITSVVMATVVGRGKPMYSLYGALVITPLTFLLYVTLIPWLEADGAALASTVSYVGAFFLSSWFYGRATGTRVWSRLVPTRSEFSDLRELPRSLTVWAESLRR